MEEFKNAFSIKVPGRKKALIRFYNKKTRDFSMQGVFLFQGLQGMLQSKMCDGKVLVVEG